MKEKKREAVILSILDGWGYRKSPSGNAVALAQTPHMDQLFEKYPTAFLTTHGEDVGLPKEQVGNSEVGHMTIGSGRKILMDLPRIDQAIANGFFEKNKAFNALVAELKSTKGAMHVVGLCSNGGVHSHQSHIFSVIKFLLKNRIQVNFHIILDGRDTRPQVAKRTLEDIKQNFGKKILIASISGRYYAMDRDNRWERTQQYFDSVIFSKAPFFECPQEFLRRQYQLGVTDEFIQPGVSERYHGVNSKFDGLLLMNFRADRTRQIASAFCDPKFSDFDIQRQPIFRSAIGLVSYSERLDKFVYPLFPKIKLKKTLGEYLAENGRKQLRIAETEKYAHVTFFLNCGREEPFEGESRILINSPKVETYDLLPEMSISVVAKKLVEAIDSKIFDFIVVNFANPDMVGHTGVLDAAILACEAVDQAVGDLKKAVDRNNGTWLLIADHGNCEQMVDEISGGAHTSHTLSPVPVILVSKKADKSLRNGALSDVAPTVLELMGLERPIEMTGRTLLKKT